MFEVGDMVVCVDDQNWGVGIAKNVPVCGGVYTVRGLHYVPEVGNSGLHLEEIVNPPFKWSNRTTEPAFHPRRFRKIRKPSIEIFREIVASVKGGNNVNA